MVARRRDYRPVGLLIPLAYAAGVVLLPDPGWRMASERWLLFFAAVGISTWGLFVLGWRFSLAGTSWVSLCDRGPYALIRHPQLMARYLIISSVAMSGVDWFGMASLVLCAALTFAVIDLEESMLQDCRRVARVCGPGAVSGVAGGLVTEEKKSGASLPRGVS